MPSFRLPLFLSLIIHGLLLGLFTLLVHFSGNELEEHQIHFEIQRQKTTVADHPSLDSPKKPFIPILSESDFLPEPELLSQPDALPNHAWISFLHASQSRRIFFLEQDSDSSSKQLAVTDSVTMSPLRIGKVVPGSDPISDWIDRKNVGVPRPQISINSIARAIFADRPKKPQLDFMPTQTEVQSLSLLFKEDSLSDTELYPLLDVNQGLTFDRFIKEMDRLTGKGLVRREKISPQQIFSLFGFPIEMSAKNRRNPQYRYKPNIDQKTLSIFLDSRLYRVKEQLKQNPQDSVRLGRAIDQLEKKSTLLRAVHD